MFSIQEVIYRVDIGENKANQKKKKKSIWNQKKKKIKKNLKIGFKT